MPGQLFRDGERRRLDGYPEVRPWIWTRKRRGLWNMHSRSRGVLLSPKALKLGRGQVPQRGVDPLAIVDLVEEPSQAPQRVAEVLVLREVDLLLLDRPHQSFS